MSFLISNIKILFYNLNILLVKYFTNTLTSCNKKATKTWMYANFLCFYILLFNMTISCHCGVVNYSYFLFIFSRCCCCVSFLCYILFIYVFTFLHCLVILNPLGCCIWSFLFIFCISEQEAVTFLKGGSKQYLKLE